MRLLLVLGTALICASTSIRAQTPNAAAIRRELKQRYDENNRAFLAKDVRAIMALRAPDFHTVGPDSTRRDRAGMGEYTVGLLNGIDRWISLSIEIDSLEVVGDLAHALTRQHVDRMALRPDGKVHHVKTWVTQRETWRRTPQGWLLYRVDGLREQRRLIDGQPG